jgi:hypothetical protein
MANDTIIWLVCSGLLFPAAHPKHSTPVKDLGLAINLKSGFVTGFAEGKLIDSDDPNENRTVFYWHDHECMSREELHSSLDRATGKGEIANCPDRSGYPAHRPHDRYVVTCKPSAPKF